MWVCSHFCVQFLSSQGWFLFYGFSVCVHNISVFFPPLRLCYLVKWCILLNWKELSWNEMSLNEAVSKAAAAWMYCLCFIDSSSLEHRKSCVSLCLSLGLFSAVGGSCLPWFGDVNRILTFLPFWAVAWKGCGVLNVRYHSKAVCFPCCVVRPGFSDSHQFFTLWLSGPYLIRHLRLCTSRAGQAVTGELSIDHRNGLNRWAMCVMGWSVQSMDRGVFRNCLCTNEELYWMLCFCFLCVLKCGRLWQLECFRFLQWPLHHWKL